MPEVLSTDSRRLLSDPQLRSDLIRFVRGRVSEAEAEDVVQTTLADALAARERPEDAEELRRWVFGIAKNKVADVHRKGRREITREAPVGEEASAESAPISARDLLRWAERELPEQDGAKSTLEWMLREGSGEKLEHIADEAQLPAARVRQRVSRLRRHYRARWAAQLAAAAALIVLVIAAWAIWKGRATPGPEDIARPEPSPEERGRELRRAALERCDAEDWQRCVDGLDRAKALDPVGDGDKRVQDARAAAEKARPVPTTEPRPEPTTQAPPPTKRKPPADTKKAAPVYTSDMPPPVKLAPIGDAQKGMQKKGGGKTESDFAK